MNGGHRWLRVVVGSLISGALLWFVLRGLVDQADRIREHDWSVRALPLLGASIALGAAYLAFYQIWRGLLTAVGGRIPFRTGARIWFVAQLGKYVPGKVWAAVGRVYLLKREGVPAVIGSMSVAYELLLMVAGGLLLSGLTLPLWDRAALRATSAAVVPVGVVVAAGLAAIAVLLHPRIWSSTARWLARLGGNDADDGRPALAWRTVGRFVVLFCIPWTLAGLGFALFVESIVPLDARGFPGVAGLFVFSWVAGSVVFVAPGGLGVREGVLLVYLGYLLPQEVAIVITVASRIWSTSVELCGVGLALLVGRGGRGT